MWPKAWIDVMPVAYAVTYLFGTAGSAWFLASKHEEQMRMAADLLHRHPELALFVTLLLGQLIGRLHVRAFGLGSVVGTLIAGIAIGILARPVLPDLLRWTFFYLILFSIGYAVGPQFFGSLRREAVPQVLLAVVLAVTGLATVVAMAFACVRSGTSS